MTSWVNLNHCNRAKLKPFFKYTYFDFTTCHSSIDQQKVRTQFLESYFQIIYTQSRTIWFPIIFNCRMLRATLLVAVVGISLASAQDQKQEEKVCNFFLLIIWYAWCSQNFNLIFGLAFSLFNVVTFKNDDCVSTSNSPNAGTLNGRCYTSQGMI